MSRIQPTWCAVVCLLVVSLQAAPVDEKKPTTVKASLEDLEYLCHHFYKDEFVVSAEVLESGCQLECILLRASGDHGSKFFDTSVTKVHHLNQGHECGPRLVCMNGSCLASDEPETGRAFIAIINGTFPGNDKPKDGVKSDAFVKLFIDDKFLAKTKVVENNDTPVWRQTFVTPVITSDTVIRLFVFDKDPNREELLMENIQTSPKEVVEAGMNSTVTCSQEKEFYLCYSISWEPLLL